MERERETVIEKHKEIVELERYYRLTKSRGRKERQMLKICRPIKQTVVLFIDV